MWCFSFVFFFEHGQWIFIEFLCFSNGIDRTNPAISELNDPKRVFLYGKMNIYYKNGIVYLV